VNRELANQALKATRLATCLPGQWAFGQPRGMQSPCTSPAAQLSASVGRRQSGRIFSGLVVGLVLQMVPIQAHGAGFPWKAGDPPPSVAGIRLGDTRERLDEVLGPPTTTQQLGEGAFGLSYRKRGISVGWASGDGVAMIFLNERYAGDIDGVRIGDTQGSVIARWGDPSSAQGETAIYRAGRWGVVLKLDQDAKVVQLYLGFVGVPPK